VIGEGTLIKFKRMSVRNVLQGQKVFDRKKAEIQQLVAILLGELDGSYGLKLKKLTLPLPKHSPHLDWTIHLQEEHRPGTNAQYCIWLRGCGEPGNNIVLIATRDRVNMPTREQVAEVHKMLPVLLKGLCKEIPWLEKRLEVYTEHA
jgi:hypothetical protein